mmetsp:Transcript_95985/g.248629  ORF Transcript_95985/g.248629 Transcript_95985/m.248629 type:complete len:373 (+) Transcript_95985:323-1441(+)
MRPRHFVPLLPHQLPDLAENLVGILLQQPRAHQLPELMVRPLEVLGLQSLIQLAGQCPSPLQLFWVQVHLRPLPGLLHFLDFSGFLLLLLLSQEQEQGARSLALGTMLGALRHCLHRLLGEESAFVPPTDVFGSDGTFPTCEEAFLVMLECLLGFLDRPFCGQPVQWILQFCLGLDPVLLAAVGFSISHLLLALRQLPERPGAKRVELCPAGGWQDRQAQSPLVGVRGLPEAALVDQALRLLAPNLCESPARVRYGGESLHRGRRLLPLEGSPSGRGACQVLCPDAVQRPPVCAEKPPMPLSGTLPGEQVVAHDRVPEDGRPKGLDVDILVHAIHLGLASAVDDEGLRGQSSVELVELEHPLWRPTAAPSAG